jgi:glycosyltransferase involved in cell wall biosynthesis
VRTSAEPLVAFDARTTSHMSAGMTTYVRKLVEHLPLVAPDLRFAFIGGGDNFDLAEQVGLPLEIVRSGARLAHIPTPYVPLVIPSPFVLTIHDLIDLHYPAFGKRKVGPYFRYGVAPVARRARAIITDDTATVADLERYLGVDPARVHVIALGVDLPALPPPFAHPRPYVLNVGNHRPHKNLLALVRAWASLPASRAVDLFFTGECDVGDAFAAYTRERGTIVFLGDRSDHDLLALYRGAAAYVHPALREGFGLPLLEAMRTGTPVIAARGALPAILAPYGYGFAADDLDALRSLLLRALDDPAGMQSAAAAAQAATAELTWERTARATADVYRELLAS